LFNALRIAVPATLLVAVVTACGGATPTTRPTGTAGQPTGTVGQPTATVGQPTATAGGETPSPVADDSANPGGALTAAVCRNLSDLSNLDYAFGKPFSVVQNLEATSKALTLQHLTEFASTAPVELAPAATALVSLWTDLTTNPSSVSESDPRWQQATDSINAWKTANCS
jgi:hypothetical protein